MLSQSLPNNQNQLILLLLLAKRYCNFVSHFHDFPDFCSAITIKELYYWLRWEAQSFGEYFSQHFPDHFPGLWLHLSDFNATSCYPCQSSRWVDQLGWLRARFFRGISTSRKPELSFRTFSTKLQCWQWRAWLLWVRIRFPTLNAFSKNSKLWTISTR